MYLSTPINSYGVKTDIKWDNILIRKIIIEDLA